MINKKTAGKILSEIKKAHKILLAFHVSPDGDSISSVLSLNVFLKKLGKNTHIVSFSKIPTEFGYLPGVSQAEIINFKKIDFSKYDLFFALDIADVKMITKSDYPLEKFPKNFKVINIDHHQTNPKFGDINLIGQTSSTAEIVYLLFEIWKVKISREMANLLFLGILSDTGCFQYPSTTKQSFLIASQLINKGADLNETVLYQYRSNSMNTIKYWGRVLDNMRLDKSGKFVISIVTLEEMKELGIEPGEEIGGASSFFAPIVKGTEFGIILDENEGFIKGSIRSRKGFDVGKLAAELGGGGHKLASGFTLQLPLEEAEKLVLEKARKAIE